MFSGAKILLQKSIGENLWKASKAAVLFGAFLERFDTETNHY